ncbi:MAG: hypothetical protein JRJ45_12825 [Deltaproteobacteria bacterium]|nr:hypothetical protein [Deltaproteobacteria bacterium]
MVGSGAGGQGGWPAVIFIRLRRVYPPFFWMTCPPTLWWGVLGKSGCCEEKCKPIIIRDADGARHSDHNPDHKRLELKPWLYAVEVKPFIYCIKGS